MLSTKKNVKNLVKEGWKFKRVAQYIGKMIIRNDKYMKHTDGKMVTEEEDIL